MHMYQVVEYFRGQRHKVHLMCDTYDEALAKQAELRRSDDTAEYVVESYSFVPDNED